MFKLGTNSLNDPPHSVFVALINREEYIIDLSRRQYGIPISDWFIPIGQYLDKWAAKEDTEYRGDTHWEPSDDDVKSMTELLCDDLKTILAAICVAFMALKRVSAEGGEKEMERLRKYVVEGVEEAKKEVVKGRTERVGK